jgi:hypothetical protein
MLHNNGQRPMTLLLSISAINLLFSFSAHPLCSYDTRGNHAGTPSHWKDEEILENRAIFRTVRSPAELVIKPVKVYFTLLVGLLLKFNGVKRVI